MSPVERVFLTLMLTREKLAAHTPFFNIMSKPSSVLIGMHEAGHITAHHYYNHKLGVVEISDSSGSCTLPEQEVDTLSLIVCACAGKAAINRLHRRRNSHNWRQSDDFKLAFKGALRLSEGDLEAGELLVKWAERKAGVLIEKNWKQVLLVTRALLSKGKLSGEELNKALGNGKAAA